MQPWPAGAYFGPRYPGTGTRAQFEYRRLWAAAGEASTFDSTMTKKKPAGKGVKKDRPLAPALAAPDLQSQLEALLDQVWDSEAEWRFDDRIALAPDS